MLTLPNWNLFIYFTKEGRKEGRLANDDITSRISVSSQVHLLKQLRNNQHRFRMYSEISYNKSRLQMTQTLLKHVYKRWNVTIFIHCFSNKNNSFATK